MCPSAAALALRGSEYLFRTGATALVPEPSTAALLVTGLGGLLLVVRKRRLR